VLACVVNISEGRSAPVLDALAAAAGADLLDLHVDAHHHRAVLTLVGEESPRAVTTEAVRRIDLRRHAGAHPRLGAVDVVPFVPLAGTAMGEATAARDRFSAWAAGGLGLPAFRYGPDGPSLPEVRRTARRRRPDDGGPLPHPTAGAVAVGARDVLVAYNVVLAEPDLGRARAVAAAVRGPALRALGLRVGDEVQVSMNLVAPAEVGPAAAYDAVAARGPVRRAELVGLVPEAVLRSVDPDRWAALDLAEDRTIEARLAAR
jgi:glutamate formiminotransferase / 5-formyltetrahydrofolate cyclo-ligase